jgi:hypothetical protein
VFRACKHVALIQTVVSKVKKQVGVIVFVPEYSVVLDDVIFVLDDINSVPVMI